MNTNSKVDTLPKLMTSTHKLIDPIYIKNTVIRQIQQENRDMNGMRGSTSQGKSVVVIQKLINSLDYAQRHFGSQCDRGFGNLSAQHLQQKFGLRYKLNPIAAVNYKNDISHHSIETIPKDDRQIYKKIHHINTLDGQLQILFMFKGFEISYVNEFNSTSDNVLKLDFFQSLGILNTFDDTQQFFLNNLQLLENNTPSLRQKGMQNLAQEIRVFIQTIKHFSLNESPISIMIKQNDGYLRVSYPHVILYDQDSQYTQDVPVTGLQTYDLIRENFENVEEQLQQFDYELYKQYLDQKRIQEEVPKVDSTHQLPSAINIQPSEENIPKQESQPEIHASQSLKEQQTEHKEPMLHHGKSLPVGLKIISEKTNFPDQNLTKKIVKKVCRLNDILYTANFTPIQFIVREKVSQKVIKIYSPTMLEFNSILIHCQTQNIQSFLENNIKVEFNMPPEEYETSVFKKACSILLIHEPQEILSEVGQEQLDNGLLESFRREFEVNNKGIEVSVEQHFKFIKKNRPAYLYIYDQIQCAMERWICSISELNQIISRRYLINFLVV